MRLAPPADACHLHANPRIVSISTTLILSHIAFS